jgi:Tol biopolymer transport system component
MKTRNTALNALLTVTIVGLASWNALSFYPLSQSAKAASAAGLTTPTDRSPSNGRIVFANAQGDDGISTMNADGSDRRRLTSGGDPAWSPDGTQIAFARSEGLPVERGVYIMTADGGNQRQIAQGKDIRSISWSPDGTRLAFSNWDSGDVYLVNSEASDQRVIKHDGYSAAWSPDGSKLAIAGDDYALYLVDVEGGREIRIAVPPIYDSAYADPAWSKDGSKIYFTRWAGCAFNDCYDPEIWTVNSDGSKAMRLPGVYGFGINSSPDGTKIIFSYGGDLFVMNPDGTEVINITNTSDKYEFEPSWGPVLSSCPDSLSPTSQSFAAIGGTSSIDVIAGSECSWSASTHVEWIIIASGLSGNGNGKISYSVAVNDSTPSRIGVLLVANRTVLVTQAGALAKITAVSVVGKKLFVFGEHFHPGSVILLNGEEQKTANDVQNPQTLLIGKKAGKRIKPGDRLQVRNPNGSLSEELTFTADSATVQVIQKHGS